MQVIDGSNGNGRVDLSTLEVNEGTIPIFASKLNERGEAMRVRTEGMTGFSISIAAKLGVKVSREADDQLTAGQFLLVPKTYKAPFETAAALAYSAVRRGHGMDYTFLVGAFGHNLYRYVKLENVPIVVEGVEAAGKILEGGVAKLLDAAERIGRQNRALLEEIADEIVRGVEYSGGDLPGGKSARSFRRDLVDHGVRRYDAVIENVRSARIILEAKKIPLGSEVLAERARENAFEAELRRQQDEERAAKERREIEMMEAAQLSKLEIEAAKREWKRKEEIAEQVRLLEFKTKQEELKVMLNPWRENMLRLKAKINADVQAVLDSFDRKREKGETIELSPATAKMLRGIGAIYSDAKLADDRQLEQLLAELNAAAVPSTRLRPVDSGSVVAAMERIAQYTQEAANEILRSGRADLVDVDF